MKKEEIHLYDWIRILVGNAPPEFLLEVLIRTIFIYLAALLAIRFLGKRMSGQLTITEMVVMILMGAIIAPAAQIPERGLLAGIFIFMLVLILQRGINWWSFRKSAMERLTQGNISMLVKDGVIDQQEMKKTNIPNQQLFSEIRTKRIYSLGEIKRVYLEASGQFSIYKTEEKRPGLAIFPSEDKQMLKTAQEDKSKLACTNCGYIIPFTNNRKPCPNCGNNTWTTATL